MEASAGTKCYGEELGVDLFDQIDDLLEFPNDDGLLLDMDNMVGSSDSTNECLLLPAAPQVETNFEPNFLLPEDAFLAETQGDISNNSGLIKVGDALNGEEEQHIGPCDELDMTQLEWLSNFFDEEPSASSFPVDNTLTTALASKTNALEPKKVECTITIPTPTLDVAAPNEITKEDPNHLFCTSSPVSVLEQTSYSGGSSASSSVSSSSSFSSSNSFSRASLSPLSPRSVTPPEPNFVIEKRPRSKRPRPASFSPRNYVIVPILPPSSESQPIVESMAESDPAPVSVPVHVPVSMPVLPPMQVSAAVMPPAKKKKKAAKRASYGDEEVEWGEFRPQATAVRRCMHCQIEKTPQWRAGPMGPKTLCNACGVRYKSGRLFPEYRPAASPTFVPSIHSNSHKKVVEMRLKGTQPTDVRGCDLLQLIRRKKE